LKKTKTCRSAIHPPPPLVRYDPFTYNLYWTRIKKNRCVQIRDLILGEQAKKSRDFGTMC
jgi:hypothetical protein